ncbi:MAG: hypothetical protein ABMA26_17200 [Limisphaerales bacterium]
MPPRPAKPRPSAQRPAQTPAPPSPRALIPIDGEPIRKKARRAYEKARRDLDQARVQLDQFQDQDRPAYERWMNTHFGQQLTALRELSRQVSEQQRIIAEVEDYLKHHEVSEAEAYAAVQQRRARSAEARPGPSPDPGNPPDFADQDAEAEWHGKSEEEAFNDFAKAFEEAFGQKFPPGMRPPAKPAKPDPAASVKELYRTLVRKLHPDKQATMTAQKLEWWHEVQAAYEDHDAERLATILSLVELSEGEPSAHTNVAMFQRLAARLKANLRDVKRQLTQHRRDPAWRFQQHPDLGVLAVEVRLEFESALRQLNLTFSEDDARIRDWADQALRWAGRRSRRMSKPAAKRRSPPGHNEFDF